MLVKKRNNEIQEFHNEKIYNAIIAAAKECEINEIVIAPLAKRITKEIKAIAKEQNYISVEEIQDLVETKLMGSHFKQVAKKYIRYRYDREKIRNNKSQLMSSVGEKLMATDVQNQNANLDERSFGGRIGEATHVVTKEYALDKCMTGMSKRNHLNNEIYIHKSNCGAY